MEPKEFKPISFPNEETTFIFVDDQSLKYLTALLAQKIIQAEENIDFLAPLAKGGWTVARSLFGYLHLPPIKLEETGTIGVRSYDGIGHKSEAHINQRLSAEQEEEIKGKNVLVVDDLTDTGEQFNLVKDYLESLGVDTVILAALFRKPHTKAQLNHWAQETTHWIIFAYEALETMEELDAMWQQKGIAQEEIKQRFTVIGFSREDINYYWERRQLVLPKQVQQGTIQL